MKIDIQKKIFHDCQLIKQMECEMKTKIKLLTHLFGTLDDAWKVAGITENALNKLAKNDFKYKSGIGIQRSHIVDRQYFLSEILDVPFNSEDELFDYYYENDKTILALSSENSNLDKAKIIPFDEDLFKNKSVGYSYTKKEEVFLKKIFEKSLTIDFQIV